MMLFAKSIRLMIAFFSANNGESDHLKRFDLTTLSFS
jgi:hypothetical protein